MPIVNLLLEKDPSMASWRDEEGLTPPLLAATLKPSYAQAIHAILEHCPESLEECDHFGNTVLHLMTPLSNEINMDTLQVLMHLFKFPSINALKNKRNNDGNTPAHIAIKNHNVELTAILINFSANLAIKNKKGVSAANMIQQCSEEFQTLVKNKIKLDFSVYSISILEVGFSIEGIKEFQLLHETTAYGNILHTLLFGNGFDGMEDNEVKEFIKQLLHMAPKLICQLNYDGETNLHVIAQKRPCLIDKDFREMIVDCYQQLIEEEEDVEELCYDPPWRVKAWNGDTILHRALRNNWPAPWMDEILRFEYDYANQVNEKGELPLHVLLKTVCNPYYKKKYADKVDSGLAYNIIDSVEYMLPLSQDTCDITDKEGLTPLLIAAQAKELQCLNSLLSTHSVVHVKGVDCNLKTTYDGDPDGNTFWHHLAQVHDDAVIFGDVCGKYCNNARKALTQRDNSGKTPIHIAIENGNFKVANMYFSKTLRDDERHLVYKDMGDKDGNVPLHLVVGRCNLPFAREFIKDATTPTELIAVHNNMGITPLHLAVLKRDVQFLNIIFDIKRDDEEFNRQIPQITDRDHNTLFHYAISEGAFEFVHMFFDEGVRAENIDEILNMPNKDGNAPFHLAVLKGNSSLATKFIGRVKEKNFIQEMLEKQNKEGNTALHLAVLKCNLEIAKLIIATAEENNFIQGILNKCNNEGNTALHLAIQNRKFEFVQCFIDYAIKDSCINEILGIANNKAETPGDLLGSAVNLPVWFEKFFWNDPKVVQAMLGVRSLSGVPTKMIKEYTNTIGVIAALLATITFTAGFTVPGGLNNSDGTPLLMQKPAFQVFMVSDIIAMCLSMMVLFFLMWVMTINNEKDQVLLLDLTVFSLQGAFYTTILTFMTGLYAAVFPSTHLIAIFACVLCSLLVLLMHKRLIIWFIPGFIHIYVWYQKVKKFCASIAFCCCNKNQNDGEPSGTTSHANEPTGHSSQTVVNIEPNNCCKPKIQDGTSSSTCF